MTEIRNRIYLLISLALVTLSNARDTEQYREQILQQIGDRDALFWTLEERKVGLAHLDRLKPTRVIAADRAVAQLPRAPIDFSDFTYSVEGETFTLEDHLKSQNVAGMMVLKRGAVVYEYHEAGHDSESRWNHFSVAKSVLGLMLGAAIEDGLLPTIDAPISEFLPTLKGTAYDSVTLHHLMRMSSGVAWSEDYTDPKSDVARLAEFTQENGIDGLIAHMATLPRVAELGKAYNYNTGEIYLLGAALSKITGSTLSDFLSEKIWKPMGAQSDGAWMLNSVNGIETAGCCITATLEDYARLGLILLNGGRAQNDEQIVSEAWIGFLRAPTKANNRYGALWFRDSERALFAAGIFGQLVYIDFPSQTVVAIHSHWPEALSPERIARRNALAQAFAAANTE